MFRSFKFELSVIVRREVLVYLASLLGLGLGMILTISE
jgi:hypothetical protein